MCYISKLTGIERRCGMETSVNEERKMARMVESGSTIETIGGIAAVVLAVVGLANIESTYMVAIAAIVLGAALLFQGGLVAAEYSEILSRFEGGPYAEFGGGLGAEALSGVTAIVLGILALFDIGAQNLMAVAAIVLGAGLVLSSGVVMRLNSVKIDILKGSGEAKHAAQGAVSAASYAQILVGLAAVILGVLALVGMSPMTLSLVAMLGVGASILLSGGSMFGRMLSLFGR
jgi:hypothetical protein